MLKCIFHPKADSDLAIIYEACTHHLPIKILTQN